MRSVKASEAYYFDPPAYDGYLLYRAATTSGVYSFDYADNGQCYFTASSNSNIYLCYLPVQAETIIVTGVTLNNHILSLTEGDQETLRAVVSPADADNRNVTWSSNNAKVATVDKNGKITAVTAGTAVITVQTADGGYTAQCTVTVTKKADSNTLPTTVTTVTTPTTTTSATSGISVTVGGVAVIWTDVAPFIDANDRTMVPLRAVADAMGLGVNWDAAAREAIFTNGSKTIYFPIGSTTARTSGGGTVQMDTAAVIVNDHTYAPIRYLAEYFGYTVDWDAAMRTVAITG